MEVQTVRGVVSCHSPVDSIRMLYQDWLWKGIFFLNLPLLHVAMNLPSFISKLFPLITVQLLQHLITHCYGFTALMFWFSIAALISFITSSNKLGAVFFWKKHPTEILLMNNLVGNKSEKRQRGRVRLHISCQITQVFCGGWNVLWAMLMTVDDELSAVGCYSLFV